MGATGPQHCGKTTLRAIGSLSQRIAMGKPLRDSEMSSSCWIRSGSIALHFYRAVRREGRPV